MSGFFAGLARHIGAAGPRIRPAAPRVVRDALELADDGINTTPDRSAEHHQGTHRLVFPVTRDERWLQPDRAPQHYGRATSTPVERSQPAPSQSPPIARERPEAAAAQETSDRAITPAQDMQPRSEIAATPSRQVGADSRRAEPLRTGVRQRLEPHPVRPLSLDRLTPRVSDVTTSQHRDRPPDVHIHIGRIELTALTTPAPPRRPSAAVKATMPLDEYLQQRSRKAR